MLFTPALIYLLLASNAQALSARSHNQINWFPCQQNGTLNVTCGTLTVPLDYTDPTSNRTLNLDLVKISAVKPKKGSILFNPGGPGEGGRDFVAGVEGEPLLIATGGAFDLIGFDTRGTGNTLPFSCYPDATSRLEANLLAPAYLNASDTTVGRTWAFKTVFAQNCYENNEETGRLIGTGFVARDMMQIVDALDEDGLLRYWGFSYGTALGATVAAMFPDRMDKVILDGVLNVQEYYAGTDVQETVDTDTTFKGFFTGCVANPTNCALAQNGTTAEELEKKVYDLMYALKYFPVVAGDSPVEIIDYVYVKYAIEIALYNTSFWPSLALALQGLLTGNTVPMIKYLTLISTGSGIYPNNGPEALWGIRCSDSALRSSNLTSLYPLIDEFYATSKIFGDIMPITPLTCAQWQFKAKGGYDGDFQVETKNPLLFIGNTYDPLTPLVSAQNSSSGFKGSVVLQHDGYGHSSLGQPSLCTAKAVRDYFEDGTLPALGTVCEPTVQLFSNETTLEAWAPLANFTKRAVGPREEEDRLLLDAWVKMGKRGLRGVKLH